MLSTIRINMGNDSTYTIVGGISCQCQWKGTVIVDKEFAVKVDKEFAIG